jgi:multidrug efflux pump subunit AcrA (membrane-fusion protein)
MRKRKWLIPVILSVVLIGGITGGMIAAADNSSSSTVADNQTADRYQALLDRACAIYQENTGVTIDPGQLKAALQQAQSEMRDQALQNRLQDLVDKGKITQGEADSYLQWWQSRPDIQVPLPGFGGPNPRGSMMWGRGFGLSDGACPAP